MTTLSQFLSPIKLNLSQLLLDPNNPRFSELGEELNLILEARYPEEKIQSSTMNKMKSSNFDVSELKDTIKTVGFLPMDRIVVRKWHGSVVGKQERYVVIEGNRRVTALKWLIDLHDNGKETFTEEQLDNFTSLDALLLDDKLAPDTAGLILPGIRHVSGVKEWGAYQKAKAVHALRKSGMSPQEAAQSLGLSTRAANTSYRCFLALEQMRSDDEFGEFAAPKMYSYFEEVFKRPDVKLWLDWSDDSGKFINDEHLVEFYGWIASTDDEDGSPKLPEAKSVRDLGVIIKDEQALNVFRLPDGSLSRALAKYDVDHPEDWLPKVLAATSAVQGLTPDMLRKMNEQSIAALIDLEGRISQALIDRSALITSLRSQ
jgi:hypothetical protein